MPTLPLPGEGASLAGGDLPVVSQDDVVAVMPAFLQTKDPAPVRDALFAGLTEILLTYQARAGYAADQADILNAVGAPLYEACAELGVYQQAGESDNSLRARALTQPSLVTPAAILAAANSLLAPYSNILPQYCESILDRTYLSFGDAGWHPYFYFDGDIPRSPDYFDRLYPNNAAQNGGYVRPQSEPGASRLFFDDVGRLFLLRIPDLSPLDSRTAGVFTTSDQNAFYVGSGSSNSNTTYMRTIPASSATIYASLINVINRIKGASVRWELLVDPNLRN